MKKFKYFVFGGIQQKIIHLVILIAVMVIIDYTITILVQSNKLTDLVADTNEKQLGAIQEISYQTLDETSKANLETEAASGAYIANDFFEAVTTQVEILGDYATKLFENPDEYDRIMVSEPDLAD